MEKDPVCGMDVHTSRQQPENRPIRAKRITFAHPAASVSLIKSRRNLSALVRIMPETTCIICIMVDQCVLLND